MPAHVFVTKVMRVITRLNVGGPARHASILSDRLRHEGYETWLVSGSEGDREGFIRPTAASHLETIPTLRREVRPLADLATLGHLRSLLGAVRPDLLHTHMAKAGTLGRLAARIAGRPITLHTFHGHVLDGYFSRPIRFLFLALERYLAKGTDALVAVSNATRDELLELGIGEPEQWRVIPLGLELDALSSSELASEDARRRLELPPVGPIVSIVGRLVPIKDHETFLQMAEVISARRQDVTFLIAGDGELRTHLERRIAATQIPVVLPGWVDDLEALYAASDVVVLTSRNEGTPVALIEAGAAARPCVATDVGGVREVVEDRVTGMLTQPGDAAGIASAVLGLLEDEALAARLGSAARERVIARFGAQRLVNDIDRLYRELLHRKGLDCQRHPRSEHGSL